MEIWEPKHPGTLWATPGLLRDSFTLSILYRYEHQSLATYSTLQNNFSFMTEMLAHEVFKSETHSVVLFSAIKYYLS